MNNAGKNNKRTIDVIAQPDKSKHSEHLLQRITKTMDLVIAKVIKRNIEVTLG